MAKPTNRPVKLDPKIKCERCGSVEISSWSQERQRHVKEKHGSFTYCCRPDYRTTTRMGRVKSHLDNVLRSEARPDHALHISEFRIATALSLSASSHHSSILDPNLVPDFAPIPTSPYGDYATSMAQAHQHQPNVSGLSAAPTEAQSPESDPVWGLSLPASTRTRNTRYRVFRPCRLRRRRPRATAPGTASSSPPPLAHGGSAVNTARGFHSNEEGAATDVMPQMAEPVDVEQMAGSLCSFSLDSVDARSHGGMLR